MKDRRIKNRPRGTVDWDEPYERRKHSYTYKERSSSMVRVSGVKIIKVTHWLVKVIV